MSSLCVHCHAVLVRGERCRCPGALAAAVRRGSSGYARQRANAVVLATSGGRCVMCGEPAVVVDHVVPLALGGGDGPENKRPLCVACHRSVTSEQFDRRGGSKV